MSKADHSDDNTEETSANSTSSTTTNDSTEPEIDTETTDDEQSFGDDFMWFVDDDVSGMFIGRKSYSTYVLGFQSFSVTFDDIRADDKDDDDNSVYKLRDGHDVQGTFDPSGENVPENVAIAFRVLAHEI